MSQPTIPLDRPPVSPATPILSFSPVVLAVPGRAAPLELRVSAPARGDALPVILLSHGHGASNFIASFRGYGPLVDFYAAHGFVVIQPTHQSSKTLALDPNGPEGPLFWRSRAQDMHAILDRLDEVERAVPGLAGRLDRRRVAAVGHSMGGHTVAMLAGMQVQDPSTGEIVDLSEPRIAAGVMLAPPGNGADLAAPAGKRFPVLKTHEFSTMTMPALVVVGDLDANPMFSERTDWRADAYHASPAPKTMLTVFGAEHMFGGISGYDAHETTDECPERVAAVQRATWAYLRSALFPEDPAFDIVAGELRDGPDSFGRIDRK